MFKISLVVLKWFLLRYFMFFWADYSLRMKTFKAQNVEKNNVLFKNRRKFIKVNHPKSIVLYILDGNK
ncbi:hypothetical protein HMI55_006968 [Coelomomyces lativittatus]|nr:hypothetical protein HMI55_006968 [Coelomomyces lativittatus]